MVPDTADRHPSPLLRPRPETPPRCPSCLCRRQRSPSLQVSECSGGAPDRESPLLASPSAGLLSATVLRALDTVHLPHSPGLVRPSLPCFGPSSAVLREGQMSRWPRELLVAVLIQVLAANLNLGSVLSSSPGTLSPGLSCPWLRRLLPWIS